MPLYATAPTIRWADRYRYLAIRYPLRSRELRTPKNALMAITLIWSLSLIFSGPYLSYYEEFQLYQSNITVCHPVWQNSHRKTMDLCTFAFSYVIPVLILSLTYARTIRYLWTSVDPIEDMSESKRAKRRVTRMIIIVAVLFCLCWLPHHLVILCVWFGYFPLNNFTYAIRILSHLVSYANSCVNPVVYALVSKHFRKGFRKIFRCLLFRQRAANKIHVVPPAHAGVSSLEVACTEVTQLSEGPLHCSACCQDPGSPWEGTERASDKRGPAFLRFNIT